MREMAEEERGGRGSERWWKRRETVEDERSGEEAEGGKRWTRR
jgi:hypothetical protein